MAFQIKYYLCKIHFKLHKVYKYLTILLVLISFGFQQPNSYDVNSKFKAVFLYSFTRYFDWPDEKKTDAFVIYVVGKNDALVAELKKNLSGKKKVGNQEIEIKNSPAFDPSITSNIIYFAPDALKPVTDAASKNKKKGVLIVAEAPGACKSGASINFIFLENKLKFEYSKNAAVKAGLKTNEDFKALAEINID